MGEGSGRTHAHRHFPTLVSPELCWSLLVVLLLPVFLRSSLLSIPLSLLYLHPSPLYLLSFLSIFYTPMGFIRPVLFDYLNLSLSLSGDNKNEAEWGLGWLTAESTKRG